MSRLRPPPGTRDHLRGDLAAPLHLVEFGDYECPFCGQAAPAVHALQEALADRLLFAFRHFPLVGSHPYALGAACAAEAAGVQGRFWEMHDLLYSHQDALTGSDLSQYAAALGLDVDRFAVDRQSRRCLDKIAGDRHSGAISGVNGTPSFFINGERFDGSYDYDTLLQALLGAAAGVHA